ncbi:unnamed protein product [Prunus armeniaca]
MVFKAMGNFTLPSQEQTQNGSPIWHAQWDLSVYILLETVGPLILARTHATQWKEIKQRSGKDESKKKVMLGNQPVEAIAQRSQDTLNNMTTMMQWQVNRQFRKDREAAMARIPNPDVVV